MAYRKRFKRRRRFISWQLSNRGHQRAILKSSNWSLKTYHSRVIAEQRKQRKRLSYAKRNKIFKGCFE